MTVIADYSDTPAEGINVISRTLVDDLRAAGHQVDLVPPARVLWHLPRILANPAPVTVFTHGPGPRTVLASRILRRLSRTRIIWVATRPDLSRCPGWLRGGRSAHVILTNRANPALAAFARDARLITQPLGIAAARIAAVTGDPLWPDLRKRGVPIALHVGHLRPNRGLDRLIEIKTRLGPAIEVVLVASPAFDADPTLLAALSTAGVHVERRYLPLVAQAYRSADLYLFPVPPEAEGAIDLPLSVLEALACRLPVIATPFGALPEVLGDIPAIRLAPGPDLARAVAAWVAGDRHPAPDGLPPGLDARRIAERILEIAAEAPSR